MMPVYAYIAPIIGDGKTIDTSYRLSISDLSQQNSRFYIPSNNDGTPKFNWGFGVIYADVSTHDVIKNSANVFQLPKFLPSTKLSDIPSNMRTTAQAKLTTLGVDYSSLKLTSTYRDLLALLAKFLEPKFSTKELDDITP